MRPPDFNHNCDASTDILVFFIFCSLESTTLKPICWFWASGAMSTIFQPVSLDSWKIFNCATIKSAQLGIVNWPNIKYGQLENIQRTNYKIKDGHYLLLHFTFIFSFICQWWWKQIFQGFIKWMELFKARRRFKCRRRQYFIFPANLQFFRRRCIFANLHFLRIFFSRGRGVSSHGRLS